MTETFGADHSEHTIRIVGDGTRWGKQGKVRAIEGTRLVVWPAWVCDCGKSGTKIAANRREVVGTR